jgi:hypothetical protein
MRLLSWNLNHREQPRKIRAGTAAAIAVLNPDLVVMTEYFPYGSGRQEFVEELRAAGLREVVLSSTPCPGEFNHILVVANQRVTRGTLLAPVDPDPCFPSNTLHIRLPDGNLDVLGVRIPDSKTRRKQFRGAAWAWIESAAAELVNCSSVIIGDFNTDPSYPASNFGDRIGRLVRNGWTHAAATGPGSWWTRQGLPKRIDHAFAAPGIRVGLAEYITSVNGYCLAGQPGSLSDHAALVVDVE